MKHFSKVLALLLATLMLVTALPLGVLAESESSGETAGEGTGATATTSPALDHSVLEEDYWLKYSFDEADVSQSYTRDTLERFEDSDSNPLKMSMCSGYIHGSVRAHDDGIGNYLSIKYSGAQDTWKGIQLSLVAGDMDYSIANGVDICFKFRWDGAGTGATHDICFVRVRRRPAGGGFASMNDLLTAKVDQTTGELVISAMNKGEIYRLPKNSTKFTDFKVTYYDVVNAYSVYIDGVPYVEVVKCTNDLRTSTFVNTTYDNDFIAIRTRPGDAAGKESLELFRIDDTSKKWEDTAYTFDVDDIVVKQGDLYKNTFELSTTTANITSDGVLSPRSGSTISIVGEKDENEKIINKHLSFAEKSRLDFLDYSLPSYFSYQFLQDGNWTVDFKIKASYKGKDEDPNTVDTVDIMRLYDIVSTVAFLSVDENGKLYLTGCADNDSSSSKKTLPLSGGSVKGTESDEWTRLTVSVLVDNVNAGKFDDYVDGIADKTARNYRIAVWVDGKYAGTVNTRRQETVFDQNAANKNNSINDYKISRVFFGADSENGLTAQQVAEAAVAGLDCLEDTGVLKTYRDDNGVLYQLKYDSSTQAFIGGVKVTFSFAGRNDILGFFNNGAAVTGAIDDLCFYKGVGLKEYADGKTQDTGVISEIKYENLSPNMYHALHENVTSNSGGYGYILGSNLVGTSYSVVNATETESGYAKISTSATNYLDLSAGYSGGKVFSAEVALRKLDTTQQLKLLGLRRQTAGSSEYKCEYTLFAEASTYNLYFNKGGEKYYLCNPNGSYCKLDGSDWTNIKVIYDESGSETLVSFFVNGKLAYYMSETASQYAVPYKYPAANISGVITSDVYDLRDAVDQRVSLYYSEAGAIYFEALSAKVEYADSSEIVVPEYLDYAAIDFSKFENFAEFEEKYGHQFIWSKGVKIENGVLIIPEWGYLTWIDYNGTFADFVDNNGTTAGKHLAGYNIEAKIKVDPPKGTPNNRALFCIDFNKTKDAQFSYVYNYDYYNGNTTGNTCAAYCRSSSYTGAIINNTSSAKFSNVAATFDTDVDNVITVTVDGQVAGRTIVNHIGYKPTFMDGMRAVAFDICGRADIAELYIHADLKRTLDSRDGNIFEYDPDVFTPTITDGYPNEGYWTPGYFNTHSNASSIVTYENEESGESFKYFSMDMNTSLGGASYSNVYLDGYLDDKITVFEYDLRFQAYDGATKEMGMCYIRNPAEGADKNLGTTLFNISPKGEYLIYNGVYSGTAVSKTTAVYASPDATEPIKFSSEKWQKVSIIYDTNAGKVSYRLDGKIPYYKDGTGNFILADNIQLMVPRYYRMDTEGLMVRTLNMEKDYLGKLDLANFKIYNINENANADYIGIQQSTSERELRLVAGLDMLYYSQAGFDIEVFNFDGKNTWTETKNLVTNTVYSSVNQVVYDEDRNSTSVKVYPENFGYRYFLTANITDVTSEYAVRMNVTPYTVVNGVKYPSDTVTLEIDLTEEDMKKWVCKTDSILVAPKGTNTSADANFSTTEIVSYNDAGALEFNGLDAKFAFAADLNGGVVSVNLTNALGEVATKSKFDIYVDNVYVKTENLEFGHHTLVLAEDLTGEHEFMIVKRTGGDYACINSMNVTGTLITPPELAVEGAVEVVVSDPGSNPYGTVNVYVQTSDSTEKYYINYKFSYINYPLNNYSYLTGVANSNNNAKMYRIDTATIMEKGDDGKYSTVYQLLQGGEISLAISEGHLCTVAEMKAAIPELDALIAAEKEKLYPNSTYINKWENLITTYTNKTANTYISAPDFVGGWHGDENIENGQIYMYIDGAPIDITKSGIYTGTHFVFDQTSIINRCDEEETPVMRHRQYMLLDTNGLRNDQTVEFLTNDFTVSDNVTFLQMCTFNRQDMSLPEADRNNPDKYVCDEFRLLDANGVEALTYDLSNHYVANGAYEIGDDEVDKTANRYVEYIGNADYERGKGLSGKVGFTVDDCSVTPSKVYVMVREPHGDNKWYASFKSPDNNTAVPKGEIWNISDSYYFDYAPNDYVASTTGVEAE